MRVHNRPQSPWAVLCPVHGQVFLSRNEYMSQLSRANDRWFCPLCHETCEWDDNNYDKYQKEEE